MFLLLFLWVCLYNSLLLCPQKPDQIQMQLSLQNVEHNQEFDSTSLNDSHIRHWIDEQIKLDAVLLFQIETMRLEQVIANQKAQLVSFNASHRR